MDPVFLLVIQGELMRWGSLTLLYCIRPAVVFSVLPATADPMLTGTIRNLLTAAFAAFAATGALYAGEHITLSPGAMLLMALREAGIGLAIGFAAGKLFWVAQCIGTLIDNMAGYNNVQLTNPSSSEQSTPVGDMLLQLAVAVFWSLGGMLLVASAIFETYAWWPLLAKSPQWPAFTADVATHQLTEMMRLVVAVATPMLFLIAVIDIALGFVSRAAKNVDTNSLATPLKSAAALLALVMFSTIFVEDLKGFLMLGELSAWLGQWRGAR